MYPPESLDIPARMQKRFLLKNLWTKRILNHIIQMDIISRDNKNKKYKGIKGHQRLKVDTI
jgi:hypothetical protein